MPRKNQPRRRAWLLNLDAELELASTGPYAPRRSVQQLVERQSARCVSLCQGELVVGTDPVAAEHTVYCWCPTPNALARLGRSRLRGVAGPPVAVLREVNHRAWPLTFAPPFPGRRYLDPSARWREILAERSHDAWQLKRPFGFAGRGQRSVGPEPSLDDARWMDDSLRLGGVLLEPAVELVREFSLHGYVDERGFVLGRPCSFTTDASGAPESIARAEADAVRDEALLSAATLTAERLDRAGYFGPFAIDAFEYRGRGGVHLNALSEVNARFTLGWSLGMGSARDAVLERYAGGR